MQSAVAKVVAVAVSVLVLASAVAVSIVVFAALLVALAAAGIYVWWKLRKIRQQIEAQREHAKSWDNTVIEGEVIRRNDSEIERR
jgi:biopolymer transport protein ExbB/TolQ